MAYDPKVWKNRPDQSSPINAAGLNHMEQGIAEADANATSAKTEVEDVRIGADGTVYQSAGEAARVQIGDLQNKVNPLYNEKLPIPTPNDGYYTATVGSNIQYTSQNVSKAYSFNLNNYIGYTVNVKFTTTSTASVRATALCDSNGIVNKTYQEKDMTQNGFSFDITSTNYMLYVSYDTRFTTGLLVTIENGKLDQLEVEVDKNTAIIGDNSLSTEAQTLTGAINEVNKKIPETEYAFSGIEVPIFENPWNLKLYDVGGGKYEVNKRYNDFLEAETKNIEWKDVYVNPETGIDSNDGSKNSPVKTVSRALTKATDNVHVILPSGNYTGYQNAGLNDYINDVGKNIFIECPDGTYNQRWGIYASSRTFTETGNGVWQNSLAAAPVSIVENDEYYTLAESLEDCQNTPKSFCHISGVLYMHTEDGTVPSSQFIELSNVTFSFAQQTGKVLIMKNIHIVDPLFDKGRMNFTIRGQSNNTTSKVFLNNIKINMFSHSSFAYLFAKNLVVDSTPTVAQNGYNVTNSGKTWFEKCLVKNCGLDGYNYHNTGLTGNPFAVELECTALNCGMEREQTINNGSTLHENFKAIRIGGGYYNSRDRVIHDIKNSKSFNAFLYVRQAQHNSNDTMDFGVGQSSDDTTEMYIYNCNVDGSKSTYNVGIYAGTNDFVKVFGTRVDRIEESAQIDISWNPWEN